MKSNEIHCLNGIAQTHYNLGEWGEHIDYKKLALAGYQEILADKPLSASIKPQTLITIRLLEVSTLNLIGSGLDGYFGKSEEAINYLNQSLERSRTLYQETQDVQAKLLEASNLRQIAVIYGKESRTNSKAIEVFTKALEIYRTFPDRKAEEAGMLSAIASRYMVNLQFEEATKNYEGALQLYRDTDDKFGQSQTLQMLGTIYAILNNKSEIRNYFNRTLQILQSPDYAENFKKKFKENRGDSKTIEIWNELNDAFIEYERLGSIGSSYRRLEDYQKSLEFYKKALAVAHAGKEARNIRQSSVDVGRTLEKLEEWNEALTYYRQALEISRKREAREEIAVDLQDVGLALLETGKASEALQYQNEALSGYQSVGVDESKAFTLNYSSLLNQISRSHYALGNRRLAIFYGKRAINAMQGERQRLQNLDLISQKGFLEQKEKHYRRLSDWLIAEGRILEAEQVLEMLKQEEIFDYLRRGAAQADNLQQRADLKPEERDALKRYNEIADKITALGVEFGKLQELQSKGIKLTTEQEKRYREVSARIEDASRSFQVFLRQLADEFAKRTNTERDFQENLALKADLRGWGEGVVFLYTLAGEDRYRVILVTADTQVDGKTEIKAAELDDKIQKFRAAVQSPAIDPRPLGKELYDILIKPVEKQLDGAKAKTLLWSLDGNLRLIPFAALWDGTQYFGQKYQNVTVTLASRTRLGDKVESNWRALGLGVSEAKKLKEPNGTREVAFKALPAVRAELRSIVQSEQSPNGVMPGQSLLDTDFNENALESQLLLGYKVIHIASHFSLNPGDSTRSFLLLGDGNVLTVDEMKNNPKLSFRGVELLTLSACQTAVVEKDSSGKEIEGFGYVAQQKGAKAILATLWSVADESTSLLMSQFYRLRKTNPKLTKSQALQMAQKKMIQGMLQSPAVTERRRDTGEMDELPTNAPRYVADPKRPYAHPYYWAPFILIGNWR